jgi:hypothetical protein
MPPGINVFMDGEHSDEDQKLRPTSIVENGLDLNDDEFNYDNINKNDLQRGFNNPEYYQNDENDNFYTTYNE